MGELKQLDVETFEDFLKRAENPRLIGDGWDECSDHYGYYVDKDLIGVFRVVHSRDSKLPFSKNVPEIEIRDGDLELSRLFVDFPFRQTLSLIEFLDDSEKMFREKYSGRVFVDAIVKGGLPFRRYEKWGFRNTGRFTNGDIYEGGSYIFEGELTT